MFKKKSQKKISIQKNYVINIELLLNNNKVIYIQWLEVIEEKIMD